MYLSAVFLGSGLISYFVCSFDVITANNDLVSAACLRREGIDCRSKIVVRQLYVNGQMIWPLCSLGLLGY